jgi:two-component system chemotaxis response regulator CheY
MPLYIARKERAETVFSSPETMTARLCLVTDDSPTVRKVAGRIIRNLGYEVDEAEDGRSALEKCESRMPDVILLDWNMPVMNGVEFLRSLRRTEGGSSPRVIFCTTETGVEHIRAAIEAGADEYLIKPFDSEMLRAKLGGSSPANG